MKYIKFNTSVLTAAILFCLAISCGSIKSKKANELEIDSDPKIMFLTYSISQDENGKKSIEFISQKTVDGRIKSSKSITNGKVGDLVCNQLDKKSNLLTSTLISDPLNKIIEFVDESNQFQTKTIKAVKNQFSIRLQLKNTAKYITISNFADKQTLIKTKIN